jgi:hypothetical protein
VHGEAWARRLCRSGDAQRAAFAAALRETGEHATRGGGPADDPGVRAAVQEGLLDRDMAEQREQVRSWAQALLAAEGLEVALPEPVDWSSWDATRRRWEP